MDVFVAIFYRPSGCIHLTCAISTYVGYTCSDFTNLTYFYRMQHGYASGWAIENCFLFFQNVVVKKTLFIFNSAYMSLACERRRISGGDKRQPEMRLRSQANMSQVVLYPGELVSSLRTQTYFLPAVAGDKRQPEIRLRSQASL